MSHNNWRCQSGLAKSGGYQAGDVLLTAGPPGQHGRRGYGLCPWIIYGGTVVLHHPFEPALLLKQMVMEKVKYTLLVPAVLNLILKHPLAQGVDLSSVRAITVDRHRRLSGLSRNSKSGGTSTSATFGARTKARVLFRASRKCPIWKCGWIHCPATVRRG